MNRRLGANKAEQRSNRQYSHAEAGLHVSVTRAKRSLSYSQMLVPWNRFLCVVFSI